MLEKEIEKWITKIQLGLDLLREQAMEILKEQSIIWFSVSLSNAV